MELNAQDRVKLQALAKELAKGFKTEADLNNLSKALVKMTVETALGAEIEAHLGHKKHQVSQTGDVRNGSTPNISKGIMVI